MTKEFNILELASELADKKVKEELVGEAVYKQADEGLFYTEEAQDLFNDYYEELLEFLINI